jgi:hypothetical protein
LAQGETPEMLKRKELEDQLEARKARLGLVEPPAPVVIPAVAPPAAAPEVVPAPEPAPVVEPAAEPAPVDEPVVEPAPTPDAAPVS